MTARRSTVLVALLAAACGGGDGGGDPDARADNFDRSALLASWGENVIIPIYRDLEAASEELSDAVSAHCAALGEAGEAAALEDARAAWRAAMVQVQRAELLQFGPAAMNEGALRDRLYSWTAVSSCAVDQEVASYQEAPDSYDISGRLTSRRGIDALGYTLFAASLDHSCMSSQTAPAGWNELPEADRVAARCGYSEHAAADVAATARTLFEAWSPDGGDYLAELASAGQSGSSFESAQAALNVVSDAMFYVDGDVKDMKLGAVAGITENRCGTIQEPCLLELESPHALHSRENVIENLRAFRMLLTGEGPEAGELGFDDMMIELGAPDLAQTMTADIDAAIAAAEAMPGPLREALSSDYESVAAAHGSVKLVTDNLKSQFLTVLGLDLPDSAAGDND